MVSSFYFGSVFNYNLSSNHDVSQVEVMTSSGRRVRKRNLDECNGNTSGSNRTKKSKGSLKSSRRKSSKTKKLRPQRVAAHNARNMLSQIGETSTDEEDNDSEDELSESFQNSDDLSEPERKRHNNRDEHKKPILEELDDVSKPSAYPEVPAIAERPRLVVKISLPKRNVTLEGTRLARETQVNVASQSSGPQLQESVQNTLPDRNTVDLALSFSNSTNAELAQSHKNEDDDNIQADSAANNLDTSECVEGNTVQCRQMRRDTHELSRSGDALLTDAKVDDHLEYTANGYVKPETSVKNCL